MDTELLKIGSRVKQARKKRHMTQLQLAEATGLSLSYIGNIENGRQSMQISTLVAISDALNVSADWLIRDLSQSTIKTANEIQRELSSCTPKEREAILKLVHLMKQSLSSLRDSQDK